MSSVKRHHEGWNGTDCLLLFKCWHLVHYFCTLIFFVVDFGTLFHLELWFVNFHALIFFLHIKAIPNAIHSFTTFLLLIDPKMNLWSSIDRTVTWFDSTTRAWDETFDSHLLVHIWTQMVHLVCSCDLIVKKDCETNDTSNVTIVSIFTIIGLIGARLYRPLLGSKT